jgi:hypothetical protein
MIQSKEDLFQAYKEELIPKNIVKVWNGDIPLGIKCVCQNPTTLFEAFLNYPEMFPCAEELIILWQTNGDSVTGYLRDKGKYIRYYLEDGPEEYHIIGDSFQQLVGVLISRFISRRIDITSLSEISNFFEFIYLEETQNFVMNNLDWEDNVADYIAMLESKRD